MMKRFAVLTLIVILFSMGCSYAVQPQPIFNLQDDFKIIFGELNNPISAGSVLNADGRLRIPGSNKISAWFEIKDAISIQGEDLGDKWKLIFNSGLFKVLTEPQGSDILWEAEITNLTIIYTKDYSSFIIPLEFEPIMPLVDVQLYQGYGTGLFRKPTLNPANEMWNIDTYYLERMGLYDIDEIKINSGNDLKGIIGNMQGTMVIPEPATIVSLLAGLISVSRIAKRGIRK